jgi:hypothetical protein
VVVVVVVDRTLFRPPLAQAFHHQLKHKSIRARPIIPRAPHQQLCGLEAPLPHRAHPFEAHVHNY